MDPHGEPVLVSNIYTSLNVEQNGPFQGQQCQSLSNHSSLQGDVQEAHEPNLSESDSSSEMETADLSAISPRNANLANQTNTHPASDDTWITASGKNGNNGNKRKNDDRTSDSIHNDTDSDHASKRKQKTLAHFIIKQSSEDPGIRQYSPYTVRQAVATYLKDLVLIPTEIKTLSSGDTLVILNETEQDYTTLQAGTTKLSFGNKTHKVHIHRASNTTQLKGVIKGFSNTLSPNELDDIVKDLAQYQVQSAHQIKKGRDQTTTCVALTFDREIKTLPKYITLSYKKYTVSTYIQPVKQCWRCNQPGHEFNGTCSRPKKCTNCQSNQHWRAQKLRAESTDTISYANATSKSHS